MMIRGEGDSGKMKSARSRRKQQIKQLQACRCLWPLEVRRNGSGHANDCPAHAMWTAQTEATHAD